MHEPVFVSDTMGSYSRIIRGSLGLSREPSTHQPQPFGHSIQYDSRPLSSCHPSKHQRQPTHSYTQIFRRFLDVVLGLLLNVIHNYIIFQYSPTSRGHRLPMAVDQLPHPKSSAIISWRLLHCPTHIPKTLLRTRCRYYILSTFRSTLASAIEGFCWTFTISFMEHSGLCCNSSPLGEASEVAIVSGTSRCRGLRNAEQK